MDLDNIDDIEELRKIAKSSRVKLREDVDSDRGNYTFKKGFWYIVDQDDYYVYIYSDDWVYSKTFTYREASEYLNNCD